MSERARDGRAAERRARHYLEGAGLHFRAANYRCRRGEIDLVMEDGDGLLVFVEVRYRARSEFGGAVASVDADKRRHLVHAAMSYLAEHNLDARPARFDVVAIDGRGALEWIADAFDAG